jgi:uncharacterized SAM-binding protein YcdF (DUF218 family)
MQHTRSGRCRWHKEKRQLPVEMMRIILADLKRYFGPIYILQIKEMAFVGRTLTMRTQAISLAHFVPRPFPIHARPSSIHYDAHITACYTPSRAVSSACIANGNEQPSLPQPPATATNGWLLPGDDPFETHYDAILVLGGGLLADGGIPPWVVRRLEGALVLYRHVSDFKLSGQPTNDNGGADGNMQSSASVPIVLLGAGTPHKRPVLDSAGFVLHESTAYATYLMARGVPSRDVLKETQSYDTVGNAYFSLTIHALPARWRRVAVVTSAFHMPRTEAIFRSTYALPLSKKGDGDSDGAVDPGISLHFHSVSDEGLFSAEILQAREEKEAAAVRRWYGDVAGFASLADMHAWIFATHLCYSVSRQHEFGVKDDLDPRLAATY